MDTSKAATHRVTPTEDGFRVVSGTSGSEYLVVPLGSGGAACTCEHGRRSSAIASRCSHVEAVVAFAEQALRYALGRSLRRQSEDVMKALAPKDPFRGLREEEPMTATMRRECAYCRADMGTKPCVARMSGSVSHGTCPTCDARLRRELGLEDEAPAAPALPTTTTCMLCGAVIPFVEALCEPCHQEQVS